MRLDIRLPLGLLFAIFGLLLLGVGLGSSKELYERSLGINVNFWWGAVMMLFGLASFILGRRSQRRSAQTPTNTRNSAAKNDA